MLLLDPFLWFGFASVRGGNNGIIILRLQEVRMNEINMHWGKGHSQMG